MSYLKQILLVDDSVHDRELAIEALNIEKLANEVIALKNGEEALDYLYYRNAFKDRPKDNPVVILLDLKMPKVDGLEVLRQLKGDPNLKTIPVVMMTSSREEQDLMTSYQCGANAYLVKPVKFQEFVEAVKTLGTFWGILNEPPPRINQIKSSQPGG
ncbi:MAG: response regulator [Verrucomicrobiales bacterium]